MHIKTSTFFASGPQWSTVSAGTLIAAVSV